jgi:hypothetical protein
MSDKNTNDGKKVINYFLKVKEPSAAAALEIDCNISLRAIRAARQKAE